MQKNYNTIENSQNISIQIYLNGFSFFIIDPISLKKTHFERFVWEDFGVYHLEESFKTNPQLIRNFKRANISYCTPNFTLIPEELFEKNEKKNYLQFSANPQEDYVIFDKQFKSNQFHLIYGVEQKIWYFLQTKFNSLHIEHSSEYWIKNTPAFIVDLLQIEILPSQVQLCYYQNKKVKYYNIFEYGSEEELIYYILLVYTKIVNNKKCKVCIFGAVDKNKNWAKVIKNQITDFKIAKFIKKEKLELEAQFFTLNQLSKL